jgi:hypothetical protein
MLRSGRWFFPVFPLVLVFSSVRICLCCRGLLVAGSSFFSFSTRIRLGAQRLIPVGLRNPSGTIFLTLGFVFLTSAWSARSAHELLAFDLVFCHRSFCRFLFPFQCRLEFLSLRCKRGFAAPVPCTQEPTTALAASCCSVTRVSDQTPHLSCIDFVFPFNCGLLQVKLSLTLKSPDQKT